MNPIKTILSLSLCIISFCVIGCSDGMTPYSSMTDSVMANERDTAFAHYKLENLKHGKSCFSIDSTHTTDSLITFTDSGSFHGIVYEIEGDYTYKLIEHVNIVPKKSIFGSNNEFYIEGWGIDKLEIWQGAALVLKIINNREMDLYGLNQQLDFQVGDNVVTTNKCVGAKISDDLDLANNVDEMSRNYELFKSMVANKDITTIGKGEEGTIMQSEDGKVLVDFNNGGRLWVSTNDIRVE